MKRNFNNKESINWMIKTDEGLNYQETKEFTLWMKNSSNHNDFDEITKFKKNISSISEKEKTKLLNNIYEELDNESYNWTTLIAASLVFITCIFFYNFDYKKDEFSTEYLSNLNKIDNIVLPDKSTISLDANSKLSVNYNKDKRVVFLNKGRAFFNVQKDEKPFIVYTKHNDIQVLGTSFEIIEEKKETIVKVKTGKVRVGKEINGKSKLIFLLNKNDYLVLDENGNSKHLKKIDNEKITMWRDNKLYFELTPLKKAIN